MSLVEKLFGSFSDRELKKVNPITKQVLALEPKYQAMSDADLQAQTAAFKQQLAEGKTLDDILPDAFAVCREAAWRVLGMKHFPVQVTSNQLELVDRSSTMTSLFFLYLPRIRYFVPLPERRWSGPEFVVTL